MEQKLDLILQKLQALDEVKEIVVALRESQEVTNAKLDALSMDVHKMNGEITSLKENTELNAIVERINDMETDLKIMKKAITS